MSPQTVTTQNLQQNIRDAQGALMKIGEILSQIPNLPAQQLQQKCQEGQQLCYDAGKKLEQAQQECEKLF